MNLRKHRNEEPNLIDLAPLIDVVFILLIFFMVSTTFSRQSEIEVSLPEASSEEKTEKSPDQLIISIDARGRFYLNERALVNDQVEVIRNALLKETGGNKKLPLIISADGDAPHQAVITAMDAARQAGITRIGFATQHASESP